MSRFGRLVRFTALLFGVVYLLTHLHFSKKEHQRILELKEQLGQETYDINRELQVTTLNSGKTRYKESSELKDYQKEKAAFFTLARNEDLVELAQTVRNYEDRFNHRFHYDWIFVNNHPFSPDFVEQISNLCSGKAIFEVLPQEFWSYPDWIDQVKAQRVRQSSRTKMLYGGSETYRFMCRFFSGLFYKLDVLKDYEYTWRVEPETQLLCDVNYDVFKYMKENDKYYGFAISIHEFETTVPTLWDKIGSFIAAYPQFINQNNLYHWLTDDGGKTYNLCHFWTNFEIVNMNFFRTEAYETYFEYLDHANGFFYERWGDAPVHSIAVSLFLDKNQVHFFDDIGYFHKPNSNCPIDNDVWTKNHCLCDRSHDVTFRDYSCTSKFYDLTGRTKPFGWEYHTGNGPNFE